MTQGVLWRVLVVAACIMLITVWVSFLQKHHGEQSARIEVLSGTDVAPGVDAGGGGDAVSDLSNANLTGYEGEYSAEVERADPDEVDAVTMELHDRLDVDGEAASDAPDGRAPATITQAAPSIQTYRKEFAGDEHGSMTPSMRRFAEGMAGRMERGIADSETGAKLFVELRACALVEAAKAPRSVRATCAENALRLARTHPTLQAQGVALRGELPKDIAVLLHQEN